MRITGRSVDSDKYRYGFNGKEKDEDGEFGSLTHYDYGFRIYNPGIGKFLSVDPLTSSYAMLTPYQFASNRPIDGIDLDGLEHTGMEIWMDQYYTSEAYLKKTDEERLQIEKGRAAMGAMALGGLVVGVGTYLTGGRAYPYLKDVGVQILSWMMNPSNQVIIGEGGALVAAAIDPDPNAQYTTGFADEFGNMVGQGIRFIFKSKGGNKIPTGTANLVDEVLELDFDIPEKLKGQGIGKEMFNQALEKFGNKVKKIKGLWTYNEKGDMSDNLKTFLDNVDYLGGTMKAEEAAFSTFTGKLAKKNGFSQVKIITNDIDEVEVLFTKSTK